jgi:hypothetical protein
MKMELSATKKKNWMHCEWALQVILLARHNHMLWLSRAVLYIPYLATTSGLFTKITMLSNGVKNITLLGHMSSVRTWLEGNLIWRLS